MEVICNNSTLAAKFFFFRVPVIIKYLPYFVSPKRKIEIFGCNASIIHDALCQLF